jgi:hypothetical protein
MLRKILDITLISALTAGLIGSATILLVHAGARPVAPMLSSLPPAKAKLLDREQQDRANAQAHATGTKGFPVVPRPQPPPQLAAGIINMHQGPFPASEFTVSNFWQGPVGSQWLLVYAGAEPGGAGSGDRSALRVYTQTTNSLGGLDLSLQGTFVPGTTGILTIEGVSTASMLLRSSGGTSLVFDLVTRRFK